LIGIVVVTHGRLAEELVNAARAIVGDIPLIAAVSIGWSDDASVAREAIVRALQASGGGEAGGDVLVLTDMFGGTPTNLSLPFLSPSVEIVTGVNLPMLIKLTQTREGSLREIARMVRDEGQEAIYVASDLLEKKA
jgi:mannose PTS system EIIA component